MTTQLEIDIVPGQLSPNAAQVYVHIEPPEEDLIGYAIAAQIRGPICRHARTLPSTHSFKRTDQDRRLLMSVSVPDPCFWSPDLPALYVVTVEVRRNGNVVAEERREVGLRSLGVRGSSFYLEGKRWVLRGIHASNVSPAAALSEWREQAAAMVIDEPIKATCEEASREGVMLVLDATSMDSSNLRQWLRWASVAFVMGTARQAAELPRHLRSSVIWLQSDDSDIELPFQTAKMVVVRSDWERVGRQAREAATVAVRETLTREPLTNARAACDLLQRDLAPFGDCAGYLVGKAAGRRP